MVQHSGVCVSRPGNVWRCRQKYSGWTRVSERERLVDEEHGVNRASESAVPRGGLQPLEPSELQPARQFPGLADVRTDLVGTRSAAHSVWIEITVLSRWARDRRNTCTSPKAADRPRRALALAVSTFRLPARTAAAESRRTPTLDHTHDPRLPETRRQSEG